MTRELLTPASRDGNAQHAPATGNGWFRMGHHKEKSQTEIVGDELKKGYSVMKSLRRKAKNGQRVLGKIYVLACWLKCLFSSE